MDWENKAILLFKINLKYSDVEELLMPIRPVKRLKNFIIKILNEDIGISLNIRDVDWALCRMIITFFYI